MTMAKDQLIRLLGRTEHAINYEQARDLLDHPERDVRLTLARRDDLEPEILYFLGRDPDVEVRRAVAVNPNTPEKAHLLLAEDSAGEVRADLADQLGKLLPDLTEDEKDKAWRATHQALTLLARDQLPMVRRVLAETLKLLPTAPRDIILTLAYDHDTDVASPILQFSPVLTDDDLLAVIASSPLSASLAAISKRYGVSYTVSDAIFNTGDTAAVASLLGNDSAQIREETLDAIIDVAPDRNSWHEPLVHRRDLNPAAALRIAEFIADTLIEDLAKRDDFSPDTIECLRDVVRTKLRKNQNAECLLSVEGGSLDPEAIAMAQQQVDALTQQNLLTTEQVMAAIDNENTPFILIATAQLADIPIAAVKAAVNSHNAKAMQALSWKAGFSAAEAVHMQLALGRVPPGDIISPRSDGSYDATVSEMTWQIELYLEEARGS
jgi:uncharacterized protein (DUF2336 family)